jgi:hypothetical protein
MFSSLQVEAIRRITVSLELCLDAAGLLFSANLGLGAILAGGPASVLIYTISARLGVADA